MKSEAVRSGNPLGYEPIPQLLAKFAVPCILGMLVSAAYNIVDQIFIGHAIGMYGNAATNVAFPFAFICTSVSLLCGIGGAANFNLCQGRGEGDKARIFIGNALFLMAAFGVALSVVTLVFLRPILVLFGSTSEVMPYAESYVAITALGFPFLILTVAGGHMIRGDGSPTYAMACNVVGAVLNAVLDPIFLFGFQTGISGAAWATVISQVISGGMVLIYLRRFRSVKLTRDCFRPRSEYCRRILSLGTAPCFNQLAMMVVQVVLNNSFTYYGALSLYGSDIPLAINGIVAKVNMFFFAFCIGMSQGLQPIVGFNYGAKQYQRVREAYLKIAVAATLVCVVAFLVYQIFPHAILTLFGGGSDLYYDFGERFFCIYFFMVALTGIQPISANFFTAIGKPKHGVFISLTRQIIFLLPLVILLPQFFGIDGILFAAPISDTISAAVTVTFIAKELKRQKHLYLQDS